MGNCLCCVVYVIDLIVMVNLIVVLLCSFDLFAVFDCLCCVSVFVHGVYLDISC